MGNRANVIFTNGERISPCIYLHWNGGPESVYAFLAELDRREVRPDAEYEAARFTQIVGELFDERTRGGLSLGILNGPKSIDAVALSLLMTDQGDNGFYVFDRRADAQLPVRRYTHNRSGALEQIGRLVAECEREVAESDDTFASISAFFTKDKRTID